MKRESRKVLIADDEEDILEILEYNLTKEGYDVVTAKDGNEALRKSNQYKPDLIILDMMMPGKSGMEVCEVLRMQSDFDNSLIIFLTAVSDEATQITSFGAGADDYINKPISPAVFVSKINALFKRINSRSNEESIPGHFSIDSEKYHVNFRGENITLPKKEFELLNLLASKPGKVFIRNEILSKVWGSEVIVGDRTIDVHIRKIRQRVGVDCIKTVKGVGYKFEM